MLRTDEPKVVHMSHYCPTPFRIEALSVAIDLFDDHTKVTGLLEVHPLELGKDLILDGVELKLLSLKIDGKDWGKFAIEGETLRISGIEKHCHIETVSEIHPEKNKSCEGLYLSSGGYFTQCEAEGFRKITWFYDRPDVMAKYSVTLTADKKKFPVLLSNGNLVDQKDLKDGRHSVSWLDPFPKPSYLFAIVAGDLAVLRDQWTTPSKRLISLEIYAHKDDIEKCRHGMESLKQSMKWDEDVYGLECDLDNYKIVAVGDFNMGAMENKGLNIFNTSAILATPETATDEAFERVQAIVAHEYFHNWSGNRVTCRDWFQLCLKEGFTVYRDQEFSSDLNSRSVKRIKDVIDLRSRQFVEDAGPMSHPVRPETFIEINNFYTSTVYEKGAEICRMIATLLGPVGFRKGSDLYFSRFDGKAVTIEDFLAAMGEGSGYDLSAFLKWYRQPGTPRLEIRRNYDSTSKQLTLRCKQILPQKPFFPAPEPLPIPLKMGVIDSSGNPLELVIDGKSLGLETLLLMENSDQEFVFEQVPENSVPSLLRGFSSPVIMDNDLQIAEKLFLMSYDSDEFNRWEMGQEILIADILRMYETGKTASAQVLDAMMKILKDSRLDYHFKALSLSLPSLDILQQKLSEIDFKRLSDCRQKFYSEFASTYKDEIFKIFSSIEGGKTYQFSPSEAGKRALKNKLLKILCHTENGEAIVEKQFLNAKNMTDMRSALECAVNFSHKNKAVFLESYFERFKNDDLVIDSWFRIQSTSTIGNVLEEVRSLLNHPSFNRSNPNRVRSVLGAFTLANLPEFHSPGGQGYELVADEILRIDKDNPQLSARLTRAFGPWRKLPEDTRKSAADVLAKMRKSPGVSNDLFEILENLLAD